MHQNHEMTIADIRYFYLSASVKILRAADTLSKVIERRLFAYSHGQKSCSFSKIEVILYELVSGHPTFLLNNKLASLVHAGDE